MDSNTRVFVILAIVVAAFVIYSQIKNANDLKKAQSGEDKKYLRRLVELAMQKKYPELDLTGITVAYAHHEDVQHYGRSTRTTYYTYALAFDDSRLWIMPLKYDKKEVIVTDPVMFTAEMLGLCDITKHRNYNKVIDYVEFNLRAKDGKSIVIAQTDVTNTKKDRFHHFNLIQQEECDKMAEFITTFSNKIDEENPNVKDELAEQGRKTDLKNAKILGIIGLCTFFIPIIGLIFAGLGYISAPKPKETNGRPCGSYIICLIGLILSILTIVSIAGMIIWG